MEVLIHIINFLNQAADLITTLISSLPAEVWTTLLGGALAAPLGQVYKLWKKIESSGKMVWVVTMISLFYSFFVYYASTNPHQPWVIAVQTAGVYLMSQPFYFKVVKKLFTKWKETQSLAEARRAEIQSALVPPEGLDIYAGLPVGKPSTGARTPMGAAKVDNFQG